MSFALRYMTGELRRRRGRVILTALGLAAGVALVIALIGVSQGLSSAQDKVLSPLSSVGSDVLVTRVAGADTAPAGSGTSSSATASSGGPTSAPGRNGGRGGGGFFRGGQNGLNQQDVTALLQDNQSLVTDLAKLGKPGAKFTRDFFLPATLLTFPGDAVQQVAHLPGVTSAVGGLSLLATHQSGTVPTIVAQLQTGGQTYTQTSRPAPMTAAERQQVRDCIAARGGFTPGGTSGSSGEPANGTRSPGAGGGAGGFRSNPAFEDCLPQRFQQFQAQVTVPLRTIRQVLNPPQTDITSTNYTVAGVDPAHPDQGSVTRTQLVSGHFLDVGTPDEVLANVAYANKNKLRLGSTIPINGKTYTVVGLVNPTLSGNTADLYFPLSTLQQVAGQSDRVNMVLVRADSSADVTKVANEVKALLPGAQVVTTKALADQVSGSLKDAKSLADRFGGALAAIVLLAAFAIAVLLTLSAVAKRVREIGTLRAIGWSRRMVVRQILLETSGIAVLGAGAGIALGALASVLVQHLSPALTSTTPVVPGQATSALSRLIGNGVGATTQTTQDIRLSVPLHPATLLVGLALALLGGLLAGAVGGWRASRLAPAVALRDLG